MTTLRQLFHYFHNPWGIYDLNGRLLKEQTLFPHQEFAEMDLADLPVGLYFYQVFQGTDLLGNGKLLVD